MNELRAQFTYSPENILQITTGLSEDFQADSKNPEEIATLVKGRREQLEILSENSGVTVEETAGSATLTIDVAERFSQSFTNQGDPDIANFLFRLNRVLPFHPEDKIDRVVSLEDVSATGAAGVINQHFQRWLNTPGVSEDFARHSLLAMALPFGSDIVKKVEKDFTYISQEGLEYAQGHTSRLAVRQERFGIEKSEETAEAHLETSGEVAWRWVDLSTLGSCACWGVNGDDRSYIRIDRSTKILYEMTPHNVDFARQSLSLMLGLGALAYYAAQYEGREDILADAEWGKPTVYPKTD